HDRSGETFEQIDPTALGEELSPNPQAIAPPESKIMMVVIFDDSGALTWSRGPGPKGVSIRQPAVLCRVAAARREALIEAEGQLRCFQVIDAIPNVVLSACEIDCSIPVS